MAASSSMRRGPGEAMTGCGIGASTCQRVEGRVTQRCGELRAHVRRGGGGAGADRGKRRSDDCAGTPHEKHTLQPAQRVANPCQILAPYGIGGVELDELLRDVERFSVLLTSCFSIAPEFFDCPELAMTDSQVALPTCM